jgi:hypothetical protein
MEKRPLNISSYRRMALYYYIYLGIVVVILKLQGLYVPIDNKLFFLYNMHDLSSLADIKTIKPFPLLG